MPGRERPGEGFGAPVRSVYARRGQRPRPRGAHALLPPRRRRRFGALLSAPDRGAGRPRPAGGVRGPRRRLPGSAPARRRGVRLGRVRPARRNRPRGDRPSFPRPRRARGVARPAVPALRSLRHLRGSGRGAERGGGGGRRARGRLRPTVGASRVSADEPAGRRPLRRPSLLRARLGAGLELRVLRRQDPRLGRSRRRRARVR